MFDKFALHYGMFDKFSLYYGMFDKFALYYAMLDKFALYYAMFDRFALYFGMFDGHLSVDCFCWILFELRKFQPECTQEGNSKILLEIEIWSKHDFRFAPTQSLTSTSLGVRGVFNTFFKAIHLYIWADDFWLGIRHVRVSLFFALSWPGDKIWMEDWEK